MTDNLVVVLLCVLSCLILRPWCHMGHSGPQIPSCDSDSEISVAWMMMCLTTGVMSLLSKKNPHHNEFYVLIDRGLVVDFDCY